MPMVTNLSIVVPCYNEKDVLSDTSAKLLELLEGLMSDNKIDENSSITFVDDGSDDATWEIIEALSLRSSHIHGIKLSCNRGQQNALMAGLSNASGDVVVSIDADLQDDISAIETMLDEYHKGRDIVYGVRESRHTDSMFKRFTSAMYYKILLIMGVDIIYNHADFRLMSRRVVNALGEFQETNLFLRGLIRSVGFSSSIVTYKRQARLAGESKYPLRKMLSLALDGITSHTILPLRLIAGIGFIIFFITILISCWALWVKYVYGSAIPGWTSSVLPIYLLGGIQLLGIGVLGEYLGKMYMETKKRPRYIIEKTI